MQADTSLLVWRTFLFLSKPTAGVLPAEHGHGWVRLLLLSQGVPTSERVAVILRGRDARLSLGREALPKLTGRPRGFPPARHFHVAR